MKKKLFFGLTLIALAGCSHPDYKLTAVKFLREKLKDMATVDTVHFFKPDSVTTSLVDDVAYQTLRFKRDSLISINYPAEAAKFTALMNKRAKTFKKILTGWDVKLVYKTKDKAGVTNTDTCRFLFNIDRNMVKYVNGHSIPASRY